MPLAFLLGLIVFGLLVLPNVFGLKKVPLEIIFILASVFSSVHLIRMGFSWGEIVEAGAKKISKVIPTIFILLLIGMLIGSWMVSGCIPLFVYYGIKLIQPDYIYFVAFLLPVVFSTLTGTSIGSIGTIGIVLISIASVIGADLPIVAGAIIGGAFFGDKLSPLSDTTNIAAVATDVDLYDHIGSMLYTTIPSAIFAGIFYFFIDSIYPIDTFNMDEKVIATTTGFLNEIFNFNLILILPVIVVLIGSIKKFPAILVLISSSFVACLLALIFQDFDLSDILHSVHKGFNVSMTSLVDVLPPNIDMMLNRGGIYMLIDAIVIALFVFFFIGTLDLIHAIPTVINRIFSYAKTKTSVILSSLLSTGITSALTNNQYAVSFIIGEAFKRKYDELKIDRRVLSRSIEDYGTILENLIPWSPVSITIVSILGISYADYWTWQVFSMINIIIAPLLVILGIGLFTKKD